MAVLPAGHARRLASCLDLRSRLHASFFYSPCSSSLLSSSPMPQSSPSEISSPPPPPPLAAPAPTPAARPPPGSPGSSPSSPLRVSSREWSFVEAVRRSGADISLDRFQELLARSTVQPRAARPVVPALSKLEQARQRGPIQSVVSANFNLSSISQTSVKQAGRADESDGTDHTDGCFDADAVGKSYWRRGRAAVYHLLAGPVGPYRGGVPLPFIANSVPPRTGAQRLGSRGWIPL